MNVTRVNGVQLHYAVEGPEDKPVIVFSGSLGSGRAVMLPPSCPCGR